MDILKEEHNLRIKLENLPLGTSKRIGIYGTGEHTDRMLEWYQELVGKIAADLFFIDSKKSSLQDTYFGKEIYNVHDLWRLDPEAIIVSSFVYEKEMLYNLSQLYGNRYKIYSFYDEKKEEDIFRYTNVIKAHKKDCPKLSMKFVDFWDGFDEMNNIISNLLAEYFEIEISNYPKLLIYSHFGKEHLQYSNCIKLFYITEAWEWDDKEYDYAFGYPYLNNNNFKHFNSYIPKSCYNRKKELFPRKNYLNRKFCNFIYSNETHGEGAIFRKLFCKKLSDTYKKVDCPGQVLNNMKSNIAGRYSKNWRGSKLEFISNYKFTISFENSYKPGYATEKLWHAFMAGSVPIYRGDPYICSRTGVNPEAIINCNEFENDIDAMIEKIKEIDNDDEKYMYILNQSPFNDNLHYPCEELKRFLVDIVKRA